MATKLLTSSLLLLLSLTLIISTSSTPSPDICIIGSGIAGSSLAHFLRTYPTNLTFNSIKIFERHDIVGGRTSTINLGGDTFEAGASIIHPKNLHALNFTKLLGLRHNEPSDNDDDDSSFGIWDGDKFLFKTVQMPKWGLGFGLFSKVLGLWNSFRVFLRYGVSVFRMQRFVKVAVDCFGKYYDGFDSRPVFENVEEMLKWAGLYELTSRSLEEELGDAGLSPKLISELVTVITRVNYGQSVSISGLAGAVSLAGSGDGLWSVKGGNWQIAAGLINRSDVILHLQEEIETVSYFGGFYELNSTKGNSYNCEVAVIATPLDESNIRFSPSISIPDRKLQHTHATFVRGLLNPAYFSLNSVWEIPELVGTIEAPNLPFSCISVLKKYSEDDVAYKIFTRTPIEESLLDRIFSLRKETIRINWGAYPHFKAPEVFAPFVLDGFHLYYINAFENAASTIETSAVAAENVARLILSRYPGETSSNLRNSAASVGMALHLDL